MSNPPLGSSTGKNVPPPKPELPFVAQSTNVSVHPEAKTTGIKQLKPPGPDSNYLNWSWVLDIHFRLTGVMYLLELDEKQVKLAAPRVSLEQDNLAVCSVIAKSIHPANIHYFCQFNTNACGLWNLLKTAHQDTTSGGVMYWLRKMTLSRMTGNDIVTHLDEMALIYEKLNLLVFANSPLTMEDIYVLAMLTLLPPDWLFCVLSMMNNARISPNCIINSSKQEDLRRKACTEDLANTKSVSKTQTHPPDKPRPGSSRYFCTVCKKHGHSLKRCTEAASILFRPETPQKQHGQKLARGHHHLLPFPPHHR
ncbi:hypothetical protein PCANC_25058 [Puccinia coronata f. sp. avenae]|uniref:CCHC-type domain-containing protein n=1 Tax=Puccinia coronata f. sp. avenae TaxID=200324 RepID=A0A2N5S5W6_9BASI|nr:hypothetical protein PCANC_25058 [Puccinia coronata f. sp. avenae]